MNITKLRQIKKLYFGYGEIARVLGVKPASARVFANRYVRQGLLLRIKRNIYILKERWDNLTQEEFFCLANIAQVPSYVSLMTALSYYELTTQIQRQFVESVAIKRTKEMVIGGTVFNYVKINKQLYNGFLKKGDFFIAVPEKALLDALYLMSLKRYSFDMTAIDFSKVDSGKLLKMAKAYPAKVIKLLEKNGYIKKA